MRRLDTEVKVCYTGKAAATGGPGPGRVKMSEYELATVKIVMESGTHALPHQYGPQNMDLARAEATQAAAVMAGITGEKVGWLICTDSRDEGGFVQPLNVVAFLLKGVAAKAGAEAGEAAATWFEIRSDEFAQRVLAGLEDGDPEVMEWLPRADLSGEFADGPTARSVFHQALSDLGVEWERLGINEMEVELDLEQEVADEWVTAFDMAAEDAVAKACERHLGLEVRV